ncbi:hypothetical protein HNR46_001305 [Haloferula luteola]|uniref:Uncharacterized protein n=1 Tax=Haloferula luteola TaxID=595692 RepID=A0A840VE06_9BACT|nr:hypothetical protein [Haloferula luteola]MBB5351071.1 hypothetical protein [Haloferula luteola]
MTAYKINDGDVYAAHSMEEAITLWEAATGAKWNEDDTITSMRHDEEIYSARTDDLMTIGEILKTEQQPAYLGHRL